MYVYRYICVSLHLFSKAVYACMQKRASIIHKNTDTATLHLLFSGNIQIYMFLCHLIIDCGCVCTLMARVTYCWRGAGGVLNVVTAPRCNARDTRSDKLDATLCAKLVR